MAQSGDTYTLWHIPSSTLLVMSGLREEISDCLRGAMGEGCSLADFMLQITGSGELVGRQVLGLQIMDAISNHRDIDDQPEVS